jgi:hypothetical protein
METTEKSLMPQMSAPVERKLFEAPAMGENGAVSVVASRDPHVVCTESCGGRTRGRCYDNCRTRHIYHGGGGVR